MSKSRVFKNPPVTAAYVRSILKYSPDTGLFYWAVDRGKAKAGDEAGCVGRGGYRHVKIAGENRSAHRVAWLYMTGEWPDGEIDHIDLDRANNRWSNLRVATHGQNQSNGRVYRQSITGLKGASPNPRSRAGKYRARIRKDGREIHLGTFNTAEDAHAAYVAAAVELHGEFARAA